MDLQIIYAAVDLKVAEISVFNSLPEIIIYLHMMKKNVLDTYQINHPCENDTIKKNRCHGSNDTYHAS